MHYTTLDLTSHWVFYNVYTQSYTISMKKTMTCMTNWHHLHRPEIPNKNDKPQIFHQI